MIPIVPHMLYFTLNFVSFDNYTVLHITQKLEELDYIE